MISLKPLGSSGMKFTAVGLGTWNMERDPCASALALWAGIEEGANHIDTAEMYGGGRVEEIVGEAVRGLRDKRTMKFRLSDAEIDKMDKAFPLVKSKSLPMI